jgi:ubiquinone/menaquinone biosynthesis C-methylase UbiE
MNSYSETKNARSYAAFMQSEEGQTQQRLVWEAVSPRTRSDRGDKILDAACGTGWFAGKLALEKPGTDIAACDASPALIDHARSHYKNIKFDVADLSQENLPYAPESFSTIVLNMALHDFADPVAVLANLHTLLEKDGTLLVTVANPYYSFPVGTWKRGWLGKLLNKKPTLRLTNYGTLARAQNRAFTWHSGNTSYFYTLPEMLNAAVAAGFTLAHTADVMEISETQNFDREYKMSRYPLVLLLEFAKTYIPTT